MKLSQSDLVSYEPRPIPAAHTPAAGKLAALLVHEAKLLDLLTSEDEAEEWDSELYRELNITGAIISGFTSALAFALPTPQAFDNVMFDAELVASGTIQNEFEAIAGRRLTQDEIEHYTLTVD